MNFIALKIILKINKKKIKTDPGLIFRAVTTNRLIDNG